MSWSFHKIQTVMFNYSIMIVYILVALTYFGVFASAPQYLDILHSAIKMYISLFLILRFNIWSNVEFTPLDKRIAYSAGVYLFTSTILMSILVKYLEEIRGIIQTKLL